MPVPHCFDTVPKLQSKNISRDQCMVIDSFSATQGIHNLCSDLDHALPRTQPLSWDHYVYVDFKYGPQLPDPDQLLMLQQFLTNNRSIRILHLAVAHDADVSWFRHVNFTNNLVLDLHDVYSQQQPQQRIEHICRSIILDQYFCVDYHHRPTGYYQCLVNY